MNNTQIEQIITEALSTLNPAFALLEDIALHNQKKVLDAFRTNKVATRHFAASEGYGYDDIGRDTLCKIFADVFETEAGIITPNIVSGTHALTLALFGILRAGDLMLCATGSPYDTLHDTIFGEGIGSLKDFGVDCTIVELLENKTDLNSIKKILINTQRKPKIVYIQRSRGYDWREALSLSEISEIIKLVKEFSKDSVVMVDNCYGEFIDKTEPSSVAIGADLCVGSLIKNVGGGLAPTGGYIVGKKRYVDLIANRLTSPSIGMEVGSYAMGYRLFYQGLFVAPHVVLQAKKSAMLYSTVFSSLGYEVLPTPNVLPNDIICSIKLNDKQKLLSFCKSVQYVSPVDSFVTPLPWAMPGYFDEVIMAAGCFVGGASIELSCDSPVKPPYIAYIQGALTFEHAKIALHQILKDL